jgi:arylsulfatase A-like enzyme
MVTRRDFLTVSGLAAANVFLSGAAPKPKGPNILLVFTDQQTFRAISCAGNSHLSTPAMDRLAQEGVRFEHAYCTSPVCGPARASLLTSRMPHETGVEWNGHSIKADVPHMGHIFRKHGYHTVWAGKWHLPESYPLRGGSKQKAIDGFDLLPFYDSSQNYPEWGYGDVTDEPLADAVASFLSRPIEQPFLMGVSFCNPHDCCYLTRQPKRYPNADQITDPLPPLPPNYTIDPNEPEFLREKRAMDHYGDELLLSRDWGQTEWQAYLWNYYRMTERVDAALNKVLTALDTHGLSDNTLVLFTSDHGDGVASHRWTAKLSLYEEATRIPFILRWSQHIPSGRTDTAHLTSQLDVLPTLCDYVGIPQHPAFRGRSVKTIIDHPNSPWHDTIVTELADDKRTPSRKGRMLRSRQYKYNVYSHGKRNEQLFDLKHDPGETQNLAYEPSMYGVVKQHRTWLRQWIKKTGDTFSGLHLPENSKSGERHCP